MVTRPAMWAGTGREMGLVARGRLYDLCFLDDRDDDHELVTETLRRFGKLGVQGPFTAIFGRERPCVDEVVSVYAEQFHRLGGGSRHSPERG